MMKTTVMMMLVRQCHLRVVAKWMHWETWGKVSSFFHFLLHNNTGSGGAVQWAVYYSVLQCAVYYSVLQCTTVYYSVIQCTAV